MESQSSSNSLETLEQTIFSELLQKPAWEVLAAAFPPLLKYCPILRSLSRQQIFFLLLREREVFYGGAAGGGKSAALLAGALKYVDRAGYAALLLRRSFPELEGADGLISQSHAWLADTDAKWHSQQHRWTFPSGATVQFGHVQSEADKYRYQGQAYQYVGLDELTHFTESQYEYIAFSRARRSMSLKAEGVPIQARAASNPGGIGHAWVKARFELTSEGDKTITPVRPGVVFVRAKVKDNPGLDVGEYTDSLSALPDELRKQLLDGDWGAFEGAAFTVTPDHLIEPFEIPRPWQRFESMDHGISNPTAWLVHAVDYEGNVVTFDSHYQPALPSETAPIILKKRQTWRSTQCFGDPSSLATRTGTQRFGQAITLADEYSHHGVHVGAAKNDPRAGYARLRELLRRDPDHLFPDWHPRRGQPGAPRWFIADRTCPELTEQLRSAPLAPIEHRYAGELIDPKWEGAYGHAVAAARYGMLTYPTASEVPPPTPDDPRQAWWQQRVAKRRTVTPTYDYLT